MLRSVATPHSIPCGRMRAASTLLLCERCCCHAMVLCSSRILALIPLSMYTRVGFLGHECISVLIIFLHAVCLLMKRRQGTGCRSSSVGQVLGTNISLLVLVLSSLNGLLVHRVGLHPGKTVFLGSKACLAFSLPPLLRS